MGYGYKKAMRIENVALHGKLKRSWRYIWHFSTKAEICDILSYSAVCSLYFSF